MFSSLRNFLFQNTSARQTIAKNTFWLFSGQMIGRLLRAGLVVAAARMLGPESWGAFSYVIGLGTFLLIFSDLGMSAIVTREASRDITKSEAYFSTALVLKLIITSIAIIALLGGARYLTAIPEAQTLLPFIVFILIFDGMRNFGFAIGRALQKMEWEGINEIITNIAIAGFGFYFLYTNPSSERLILAYIIGTAVGFGSIFFLLKNYFARVLHTIDFSIALPILKASLPFALASFLGAIMINTDLIMLGWLRTPAELGFYAAAQKPVLVFYTVASLFATSLFPLLTKTVQENKEKFKNILEGALAMSLMIALPLAIGGIIVSNQLILLLFGAEYASSIPVFQILMLSLLIIFPSVIITNSLLAHNQERKFITFSLLGALGNIFFNALLIPILGIVGCALATIFSQLITNMFIWRKMYAVTNFSLLPKLTKIVVATIIAMSIVWVLNALTMNVFAVISIGIISYGALLLLMKEKFIEI
ncbi:MAG: flippase [bacterium]|nr:flippase [bacterium]